MLRLTEIKLPLDHPEEALRAAILQRLGIAAGELRGYVVSRRAYDARKKSAIHLVYSLDVELRWAGQNVDRFFGSEKLAGNWSFEHVARVGTTKESYLDGAETKRTTWGVTTVIGWKHTWYLKPLISGDIDYEFTDRLGSLHDIDTKLAWNLTLAFKPAENFLIYAQYTNPQSLSLTRDALEGRSLTVTADLSF